ncbi:sensor histidine kinase [Amycolatopsis granulosa]|uniref:sensor histidine kinase n=1 Tax=Amycolatopsis granulosa TaxID=185684 RepID=UPI001FB972D6|nr:sensor histidine kinase [Amycolatopsis granulosa]NIH84339.1 two-component system CitB family sensor kinase [Amycolatopsis granulosa]
MDNGVFARLRFSRQILILQIAVVALVLVVGMALVSWLLWSTLRDQYGERALGIAHTVSVDPVVVAGAAARRPGGELEERVQAVTARTGALFVVITDDRGIRLAHPDPAQIGEPVSTDPSEALAGNDVVSEVQEGTLGVSVRSKTPIRGPGGRVVGEVSVGYRIGAATGDLVRLVLLSAAFAAGALALGAGASALLTRRLHRLTHGLEPRELTELLYEREAVLHGIGEGMLALDAKGRVSARNAEAERLLGRPLPVGAELSALDLSPRLRRAVAQSEPVDNLLAVAGDRVLVVNSRAVRRDDRDLGTVLTLRDRTDLDALTRELDAVRSLSDGLRAQRHEFRNRLHTLSGLLQLGHNGEAIEYLQTLTETAVAPGGLGDAVTDPYLRALVSAKIAQAREKDVELRLSDDSWVRGTVTDPSVANTVVGNLLDNAVHAARIGARRPATVEIALLQQGPDLHVSVVDSGAGVARTIRDTVFDEGVSTKLTPGHGLGLALARQAARARGGDVWLADPGGEHRGALFVAALPGLLSEEEHP